MSCLCLCNLFWLLTNFHISMWVSQFVFQRFHLFCYAFLYFSNVNEALICIMSTNIMNGLICRRGRGEWDSIRLLQVGLRTPGWERESWDLALGAPRTASLCRGPHAWMCVATIVYAFQCYSCSWIRISQCSIEPVFLYNNLFYCQINWFLLLWTKFLTV